MTSTRRIVVNVFASYGQSLVSFTVGVFCSRWLFNALGVINFGLFSLVGSIIVFITFINSAMSYSAARHFAYAIGKGRLSSASEGRELLCEWFNTSLGVHVFLPLLLIALGYPIGIVFIRFVLTIPPEALDTCIWVFRFSLMTAFASMCFVPFRAIYVAKQLIFMRNLMGVVQTFLYAAEGWWLLHFDGNRLLYHAILSFAISFSTDATLVTIALVKFTECRIKFQYWFDRIRLRKLVSYAVFNSFESFGHMLRMQGLAVLLNTSFGPALNAANGIGNQVSSKIAVLPDAIMGAVAPEITTSMGGGHRDRAILIGRRIGFYGTTLSILVLMPLMVFLDKILVLWLKAPPPHAAGFCIIAILLMLSDKIALGHKMLVQADGNIREMQIVLGSLYTFSVLLVWVLIHSGFSALASAGIGILLPACVASASKVWFARKVVGIPVRRWASDVLLPVGSISAASFALCWEVKSFADSFLGFFFSLGLNSVITLALFTAFLRPLERQFIGQKLSAVTTKFMNRLQRK